MATAFVRSAIHSAHRGLLTRPFVRRHHRLCGAPARVHPARFWHRLLDGWRDDGLHRLSRAAAVGTPIHGQLSQGNVMAHGGHDRYGTVIGALLGLQRPCLLSTILRP